MVTPEKLAARTYPGIQELHSKLKSLTDSLSQPRISHNAQPRPFPPSFRQYLYACSFNSVSAVVERLLSQVHELSADARIALHTTLSNAHHFVAVILPLFYEHETLLVLCDSKQHIDLAYSEHGRLLTTCHLYPRLKSQWKEIGQQKKRFRNIAKHIIDEKFWERVTIHRVTDNEDESMSGKRAVLNPTNPSDYPEERFYKMYSETSYVVDSTTNQVEYHVLVSFNCPETDDELRELIARRKGDKFVDEKWFIGAHVLNLHRVKPLKEWMDEVTPALLKSISLCRHVRRSTNREDRQVAKDEQSAMIATGVLVDQNGHLRPPHNTPNTDEDARFELLQANEHILDGVIFVRSSFPFCEANIRLARRSFHGCFDSGMLKELKTTVFHLVCSNFPFRITTDAICSQDSHTCCSPGSLPLTMPNSFTRTRMTLDRLWLLE
jgi:hypothetical protein